MIDQDKTEITAAFRVRPHKELLNNSARSASFQTCCGHVLSLYQSH